MSQGLPDAESSNSNHRPADGDLSMSEVRAVLPAAVEAEQGDIEMDVGQGHQTQDADDSPKGDAKGETMAANDASEPEPNGSSVEKENLDASKKENAQPSDGKKKPEPKRPGKESGRFWKCYWQGCDNVYTRRRTVTDHMMKAHKIKKEEFDTELCREIIYLDEAKTKWQYLEHPRGKRPPKKGIARPSQAMAPGGKAAHALSKQTADRLATASPTPENMAKRKISAISTPTKSAPGSRAGSPPRVSSLAASPVQSEQEDDYSGEDDYDDDEDNELYCICRKPDDGTPMVCCDGCDEWYHIRCIGLHKDEVNNLLVKFYCPECVDNGKGESIYRIECGVPWCRKAGLPEFKHQFCGPDHHEAWILYYIKKGDPSFSLKSKDAQQLYSGWVTRMKKKYGDQWEPQSAPRGLDDKMGKINVKETDRPTLGGSLKAGELKSLVDCVQTAEEFKLLGKTGNQLAKSSPIPSIQSQSYLTRGADGKIEDRIKSLKELLEVRRQVLTNAKAAHKPRQYCGYDERLGHGYESFKKVLELGEEGYRPCEQKNCKRHVDWVKNETRSLGLETELLREHARTLGIKI